MTTNIPELESCYDVVVIGAGPAGLTCAIFLGRYLLKVLVIDTGRPRNYASRGIHGFLGQHSILPRELLKKGRLEAETVGVQFLDGRATSIGKTGDLFQVDTAYGTVRARRAVLAYGVRDTLPDIPGFEALYGNGVYHCPDCDGFEVTGKRVGVVGEGQKAAGVALHLLQWSKRITIFTDGHEHGIEAPLMDKLMAETVAIETGKILRLEGDDGGLRGTVLESGEVVDLDALFFTLGVSRSCDLGEELGCEVENDSPCFRVDEYRETTVPGLYAIGDLAPGSQLAITSAADGAIAAIAINKTLLPPNRKV